MSQSHVISQRMSESESASVESCYTCGIALNDDTKVYVTGFSSKSDEMRQFCDKDCLEKNMKYVSPTLDKENPFMVPVKGKCGNEVINGVAEFDIHGTIRLHFNTPELDATIEIPEAFYQVAKMLFADGWEVGHNGECGGECDGECE